MPTKTTAAVVRRAGQPFAFARVRIDDPRPDEVLVRIVACGICHTDIASRDGAMGLPFPAVFGHEGAGVVEAVGVDVARVRPGDRVVMSFSSCGRCPGCRSGHPARCASFDELNFSGARTDGTPTIRDGRGAPVAGLFMGQSSLAGHALTRARNVVPVEVPDDDGLAALAPLGCGVQTGVGTVLNELRPRPGESVAVFGAGAVGLSAVMAARMAGAEPIVAVDIVPARLDLARELGATAVVHVEGAKRAKGAKGGRGEDVAARLQEIAGWIDHAVETTGASRMIDAAMRSLGSRGKASLLAISADEGAEAITPASPGPGQEIIYSIAGDSDPATFIPRMIGWHGEGKLPFDRMIREYPASRINQAARDAARGAVVKPVLRF